MIFMAHLLGCIFIMFIQVQANWKHLIFSNALAYIELYTLNIGGCYSQDESEVNWLMHYQPDNAKSYSRCHGRVRSSAET